MEHWAALPLCTVIMTIRTMVCVMILILPSLISSSVLTPVYGLLLWTVDADDSGLPSYHSQHLSPKKSLKVSLILFSLDIVFVLPLAETWIFCDEKVARHRRLHVHFTADISNIS